MLPRLIGNGPSGNLPVEDAEEAPVGTSHRSDSGAEARAKLPWRTRPTETTTFRDDIRISDMMGYHREKSPIPIQQPLLREDGSVVRTQRSRWPAAAWRTGWPGDGLGIAVWSLRGQLMVVESAPWCVPRQSTRWAIDRPNVGPRFDHTSVSHTAYEKEAQAA